MKEEALRYDAKQQKLNVYNASESTQITLSLYPW